MQMRKNQLGLSLVEVLIAMALLVLACTPLLSLFVTSRKNVEDTTVRTEALALARATMDEMVARAAWATIRTEGPHPHPLDATFTATVIVTPRSEYFKDVLVQVAWTETGGGRNLTLYSAVHRRE